MAYSNQELNQIVIRQQRQIDQLVNNIQSLQNLQAQMLLKWERTFTDTPSAWMTKEDFVNVLIANGALEQSQSRSRRRTDNKRYFTDKIRRDNPFVVHDGESAPPRGAGMWRKTDRVVLFHRTYGVRQFIERFAPAIMP